MSKQVTIKKRNGATPGRPRKYSDTILVRAALRVMEREGYSALSMRSLAKEVGTTPATLYNYVDAIKDIEAMALQNLAEELPLPSATTALDFRSELLAYLASVRRVLFQHPSVIFSTPGSACAKTLTKVSDKWLLAMKPYVPSEKAAVLALGALTSTALAAAERDRALGLDYYQKNRKALQQQGIGTFEGYISDMVDFVLPGLASTSVTRKSKNSKG